jgi:hypothetical protein
VARHVLFFLFFQILNAIFAFFHSIFPSQTFVFGSKLQKTAVFSTRESYNLLNISIKTTFSGDVGVQHHPNITLNDTRSAPYHKGPAKRVMLVRSKNKNFLVEIFLLTMSELVQNTSHFQLENALFTSRS